MNNVIFSSAPDERTQESQAEAERYKEIEERLLLEVMPVASQRPQSPDRNAFGRLPLRKAVYVPAQDKHLHSCTMQLPGQGYRLPSNPAKVRMIQRRDNADAQLFTHR